MPSTWLIDFIIISSNNYDNGKIIIIISVCLEHRMYLGEVWPNDKKEVVWGQVTMLMTKMYVSGSGQPPKDFK